MEYSFYSLQDAKHMHKTGLTFFRNPVNHELEKLNPAFSCIHGIKKALSESQKELFYDFQMYKTSLKDYQLLKTKPKLIFRLPNASASFILKA